MSLYTVLSAGVSGLAANATMMATVADNITNVNTVGYKGSDAKFVTLVSAGSGTGYSAGGVEARPQALISKQGLLQASASDTDLAIDGNGFFVVRNGAEGAADMSLTRAGSFRPDAAGYLRNDAGLYLQGWRLDSDGNYANGNGVDDLGPIRISELNGTAEPTTRISIRANLSSQQAAMTPAPAAGSMATGVTTPHFSRSFETYDAQGTVHPLTVSFVKVGANEWQAEIYTAAGEATGGDLPIAGTIRFNADGSLDRANSTAALFDPINVTWANGAGSSPITFELGDDAAFNGLTQFGTESTLNRSSVDGAMLGSVTSVEVAKNGVVSAIFGNGAIRPIFQLPVATVPNPDGLRRLDGNAYAVSGESGSLAINPPGEAGGGLIAANALEGSNVDLAEQFTKMIVTQRAYGAAGKVITTADEMLQELSQLKR